VQQLAAGSPAVPQGLQQPAAAALDAPQAQVGPRGWGHCHRIPQRAPSPLPCN
jgi:hypothetical protein